MKSFIKRVLLLLPLIAISVQVILASDQFKKDATDVISEYVLRIRRSDDSYGIIYAEGETRYGFLIFCMKKDQGEMVGGVQFEAHHLGVNAPIYGYIAGIKVDPELQGQGIGSLLLQAAMQELAEHGCDYIGLIAHPLDMDGQHPDFDQNLERLGQFYGRFDFVSIDWQEHPQFYDRLFKFVCDPEQIAIKNEGMHLLAAKPFSARVHVPELLIFN